MALGAQVVSNPGTSTDKFSAIKDVTFTFNTTLTTLSSAADADLVGGKIITPPYPTGGAADATAALELVTFTSTTGSILLTFAAAHTAACTWTVGVLRGTGIS